MKRLILLPVLLLVLGVLLVIKNKADQMQKQTYVSQVIIDAPWGEELGQFGIYDPPEGGPTVGPSTFSVTPEGDIYILDLMNGRVQKFGPDGRLLFVIPLSRVGMKMDVDQLGNVYIYDTARVPKKIIQYDSKGNLLKEYLILWSDGEIRGGDIYCDNSGRIFLCYRSDSLKTSVIFQVGTTEIDFTPEQQKATLREGFAGSNNVVLNQGRILQTKEGNLCLVGFDHVKGEADSTKSIKEFSIYRMNLGQAGFTGVDEEMNIYTCKYDMENDFWAMRKYNPDGNLVAEFNIEEDNYAHANRALVLDEHGNIYVMSTSEDGLKIIKWSPVEGGQ